MALNQILKLCLLNRTIQWKSFDSLICIDRSTRHMIIHHLISTNFCFPVSMVKSWHTGIPGIEPCTYCINDNIRSLRIDKMYKKEFDKTSIEIQISTYLAIELYADRVLDRTFVTLKNAFSNKTSYKWPKKLINLTFDEPKDISEPKFNTINFFECLAAYPGLLNRYSNKFLKPMIFPDTLTHLELNLDYNYLIPENVLPKKLTYLHLGNRYDNPLALNVLPPSLTHLNLGDSYNQSLISGTLPQSLKHLEFGNSFNKPLNPGILPSNLTRIEFGNRFNQQLEYGDLPEKLQHLKFGHAFNRPLPWILPPNLTRIEFGNSFNQHLYCGDLPETLQHLKFGSDFNCSFDPDSLPPNLISLEFGNNFNQSLAPGILSKFGFFDDSLSPGILPPNLTSLKFGHNFDQKIEPWCLPETLKFLEFSAYYTQTIDVLPPKLEQLIIPSKFVIFGIDESNYQVDYNVKRGCKRILFGSSIN